MKNIKKREKMYFYSFLLVLLPIFILILPLSVKGGVGERKDIANVYSHKENCDMKIALTFDDGPHGVKTAVILDILKKYSVPATFFVLGENAEKHPEIIKREIKEGHEIGNHTYSHLAISEKNISGMRDEIIKTENSVYEITEYRPKLFRPPEGRCNENIASIAASLDYSVILWNIDTRDWAHTSRDCIVDMVLNNIESGDIVLFHDAVSGKSNTADALEIIIPKLKEKGYIFVTVSELLES